MREILTECIRLDGIAAATYESMRQACPDAELAITFHRMGLEERAHVEWWGSLLEAWDEGLVPQLDDRGELLERLKETADQVDSALPDDLARLSIDQMLEVAVHLEFYMLDPAFAELIELTDPGAARSHRDSYSRHIDRLVTAIEHAHEESDLARFLAAALGHEETP